MVRHDHPARAVLHRELGVFARDDALHEYFHWRRVSDALDVIPRRGADVHRGGTRHETGEHRLATIVAADASTAAKPRHRRAAEMTVRARAGVFAAEANHRLTI